ncbi:uncharacterized protein LOC141850944 [Brevipalpus obovatus]|uniref:uncharacterized protein LOC141850944 n=1 Tax=Brevipalpus obovatus TaxID=246614 RepID=UPI003D9E17CD
MRLILFATLLCSTILVATANNPIGNLVTNIGGGMTGANNGLSSSMLGNNSRGNWFTRTSTKIAGFFGNKIAKIILFASKWHDKIFHPNRKRLSASNILSRENLSFSNLRSTLTMAGVAATPPAVTPVAAFTQPIAKAMLKRKAGIYE